MGKNWQLVRKRPLLEQRARIIQLIRAFFVEQGFLEVETPQRIPANAPEAHIDAVPSGDWFLHTSPELAMKRLLAAGYEQIFQICHCWRAGERGSRHLPEYTMLEWYRSHCNYHQLMTDCEELLNRLCPQRQLVWQGQTVDLSRPWERLTVQEAFARHSSLSLEQALKTGRFDEVIALEIEPRLPKGRPLFLTEYPAEHAALARLKPGDERVAERFELYLCGMELANAFSELNDPQQQRGRFSTEEQLRREMGKVPYPTPEPFFRELAAMPDCAGIALGIDRLIMLLTDSRQIDETVPFSPEML